MSVAQRKLLIDFFSGLLFNTSSMSCVMSARRMSSSRWNIQPLTWNCRSWNSTQICRRLRLWWKLMVRRRCFNLHFIIFFIPTAPKLLASTKSRVQLLMQHYRKEKKPEEINEAQASFEKAMIEDSMRTFRPRNISLDFDWIVSTRTHRSKHLIGFRKSQEKTTQNFAGVADLSCLIATVSRREKLLF